LRRILITGATGFIGEKLTERLHDNCNISVLLRRECKGQWDSEYFCDFSDGGIPEEALDGIDTVFHLAAFTHDTRKTKKTNSAYRILNTGTTIKLAKLAAKKGVKRFLFVSSVKAGGSPSTGCCVNEMQQGIPDGIYGQTKRDAEVKLLEIGSLTGMHVSIIRPALVYGPNVKGNLKLMLNGISQGWFPPLPDSVNVRSMVHINDLVNAIILASEKNEANGEVFIVTDGEKYSSREIYNEICLAIGMKIPKWSMPKFCFFIAAKIGDILGNFINMPFDSSRYQKILGDDCYCSEKIQRKLGFVSNFTFKDALPDMVERTKND